MISLRFGAVLLLPALGFGCFLDESPNRDGSSSSSTMGERTRSGSGADAAFTPREPGMSRARSQGPDGGAAQGPDAGEPADAAGGAQTGIGGTGGAGGKGGAAATMDAGAQAPVKTQHPDAGMPLDAHVRDPQVPAGGAPAVMDAGAPPAQQAHDAQVAGDAQPPTAADAGSSSPGQAPSTPIMPIHRYDFSGTGRVAVDRIGGKDATLRGEAYLDTRGNVQLGQSNDDAVELPNRILAGLNGFTLLGWMELRANDCWRRLFDFIYYREGQGGNEGRGRGNSTQVSALYLTPNACPDNIPRLGYITERSQVEVDGEDEIAASKRVLLGAAYDSKTGALQLIVDGAIVAEEDASIVLRELTQSRGTLGSPTNTDDRSLSSNISEFRIYDHALDEATLAQVARRGPDQL